MSEKKNIVIFASGSGTNALNLAEQFKGSDISIKALFCDIAGAGVIEKMYRAGIPVVVFPKKISAENLEFIKNSLSVINPDLIVLAGFMRLFPVELCKQYEGRIVNIHPALLPAYGGKGMYGMKVHEAVIANKEKQSGITIHYVNEHYDEGAIIKQASIEVSEKDTPETLASRIHELEYLHLPQVVKELLGV